MDTSVRSNYLDYEWSIVLNRICLKFIGIWPGNEEKTSMSDVYFVLIITSILFSCTIPSLHSLVRIWGNVLLMIDNLQYTLPFLIAVLKAFIIWRKKKKLVPILKMFKEDWLKRKTEAERNVMIRRARTARAITIFGYIVSFTLLNVVVILPSFGVTSRYVTNLTDPGRLLPFQTYYIYDKDRSPFYEMTFVLQGICGIMGSAMFTGTDAFMGLLVLYLCGQLENLRAHILHFDVEKFESALLRNVDDHERLIRSIKTIDDTFTMMMLGLLLYFGFLFVLQGFLLVMAITQIMTQGFNISLGRIIFTTSIFINAFAHMCLYYILGEILVIQCEGVYEAVCEYDWYKLQPKQARCLMLIMIRANKPLYLTAGKLFPMTMSAFCNLLKTSGGYISVLLAHRESTMM